MSTMLHGAVDQARPVPSRAGRFAGNELQYLKDALAQPSLFYWPEGRFVSRMLEKCRKVFGARHAVAASSGSASLHIAVGSVGVRPGDEVVTAPITDMGTLIGILYQNAIPVFADVDPRTYQLSAESIQRVLTPNTKAVLVVHLMGAPTQMDPIVDLCRRKGIALIEDCAQAFGCRYRGQHVGTFGNIGCFSLNDFKHLGAGDGGFVLTNNDCLEQRALNFSDKFYDRRVTGVRLAELAPNYRLTELQAAVALAQLERIDEIVARRRALGEWLREELEALPGILAPRIVPEGECSYWFFMFRVDEAKLGISRDEFASRMIELGVPAEKGYIARPIYREPMFVNKTFFGTSVWPAEVVSGRTYDYGCTSCPNAEEVLRTAIRLPLHEFMARENVEDFVRIIRHVALNA